MIHVTCITNFRISLRSIHQESESPSNQLASDMGYAILAQYDPIIK